MKQWRIVRIWLVSLFHPRVIPTGQDWRAAYDVPRCPARGGPATTGIDVTIKNLGTSMRFVVIAGLLALAMSSATAESTDVLQRAIFDLKGTMQTPSGVKDVRLGNKDIIAALNASGAYNFGPKAILLFDMNDDQAPGLIVQDGDPGQRTNTDVSAYFAATEVGDEVRSRDGGTVWQTWQFGFGNGNSDAETSFILWGATTMGRSSIRVLGIGMVTDTPRFQSNVRGVGRVNGAVTVFSGTVSGQSFWLIHH
jgi:hypothetical protein